jgi:type 1 glutamine amidotransferase
MLGVLSWLAAPFAAQAPQAGAAARPLQVLILTGRNVGEHQWRLTSPIIRQILEGTTRFEVRTIEEVRGITAETLAPYDLLLVNYYNRTPGERWGERTERAVEDFVRAGKGLVIYHVSLAAFEGWTAYEQMSGGNWRPNNGHHSDPHAFTLDIVDREHPVTRGLGALPVRRDELYANLRWQPTGAYHVLATAYDDHALYNGKAQQPIPGPGLHQPILWTTGYGQGRVFNIALGHLVESVQDATFGTVLSRGAEWAATGAVTLPPPAGPAPATAVPTALR